MTTTKANLSKAPIAVKKPQRFELHGDVRVDDYFWMREKENPETIAHLKAENAYTEEMLADVKQLREDLFQEMKARLKEDDAQVPARKGPYVYYTRMEPGRQYGIYCRKRADLPGGYEKAAEEILLDGNAMAEGQKYFGLGIFEVSPDHKWLAFGCDFDGSEKFQIRFKNLETGEISLETITKAHTSLEWANDNRHVFYTLLDDHERPDRVLRHELGTDSANDQLIYKEADSQLFVYVGKTLSEKFLFIELHGKVTSEYRFLPANEPFSEFKVLEPRRKGVLYSVDHSGDHFYIVTNDEVQNFRLVQAPVASPDSSNWKEIKRGDEKLFIEACESFKGRLVLHERNEGLRQLRIMEIADAGTSAREHVVAFPEPVYNVGTGPNYEFDTDVLRMTYTSMVTPSTVFDYDMNSRSFTTRKVQEIPSGYDRSLYRSERIFATAPDGTRVPISLVYKLTPGQSELEKDGSRPLYLYGYGSYGMSLPVGFSTTRLSLINRGFVWAMAHIRGGSDMGRQWYENGKFLKKKNTFIDFIACAEHLVMEHYAARGEIAIAGGSAGGMLMGAVLNMRPELFRAAAAHVPFVDVINTMLDETLPLTTIEFEEWGNPKDREYYEYMKSYSPYDNVEPKAYPHLLVTSGLNDPRVTYWEPAKWVAKLRELKIDDNMLLQHINMEAGHGGPSGRYESLKETALEYAFILKAFDKHR